MFVQRSPPEPMLKTPPNVLYGSDSALNETRQNKTSVQHSPPGTNKKSPHTLICGSDSAINKVPNEEITDHYLNLNITKRQKRTFNEFTGISDSYMSEIKNMFVELKAQQEQKFDSLHSTIAALVKQNDEIEKSVKFMSSQHDELINRMKCLEQENSNYKKRVTLLESKLELSERNSRSSTVEIRNIPRENSENKQTLLNVVKNTGEALGLNPPVQELEIKDAYRSKSEALVIEFTSTIRKESVLTAYKLFNKSRRSSKEAQLNTQHIHIRGTPLPVYVSESLTSKARRLHFIARVLVKNKKLAATWTSFGKVYVKKEEGQAPIHVEEETELHKLTL